MKPVNPNATKEACALLDYLYENAGKKIISGQHTQTVPMEEISYIEEVTGKKPKLQGFELLGYSPNINRNDASVECLTEVDENYGTVETALKWAKETSGIVHYCFHWFSPIGGRDKSFYAKNTDFDARDILVSGSEAEKKFYSDLDVIAVELRSRFSGDRFTKRTESGSGGVQRVTKSAETYTVKCLNITSMSFILIIYSGSGIPPSRRAIRETNMWMLSPETYT